MGLAKAVRTAAVVALVCTAPLSAGSGGIRLVLEGPSPAAPPGGLAAPPWVDEDLTGMGGDDQDRRVHVGGTPIENRSTGQGCTSGLPWRLRDGRLALITAGHCAPAGGIIADTSGFLGTITQNEQNWEPSRGTRLQQGRGGHPGYHGDLALIRVAEVTARLVVGPIVAAEAAERGQRLCTLGAASGELCGWIVTAVGVNAGTPDGLSRNVVLARKKGHCVRPGDSGGPVYRYARDGLVVVGVISSIRAPDDYYTGRFEAPCEVRFTDVTTISALWEGRAVIRPRTPA